MPPLHPHLSPSLPFKQPTASTWRLVAVIPTVITSSYRLFMKSTRRTACRSLPCPPMNLGDKSPALMLISSSSRRTSTPSHFPCLASSRLMVVMLQRSTAGSSLKQRTRLLKPTKTSAGISLRFVSCATFGVRASESVFFSNMMITRRDPFAEKTSRVRSEAL